jgi:phospholipase/carboxylesterase
MEHPHEGQPVLQVGEPLDRAGAAMVLLHGRGASARDILTVAEELMSPGWTFIAPQARDGTWYPYPFTAPLESNQPWLGSALRVLADQVASIEAAIPLPRVILLGFSQGACLTLEFAARNARRYGGIVGLSGGLIGPDIGPRSYPGSLDGTPMFLGCSDVDPHIPKERVEHAAEVLRKLGGQVTARLYPGMGHAINQDELDFVRRMAAAVLPPASVAQPGD